MSFKPEIKVTGESKWHRNSLVFATKEEAENSARDLFMRWTAAEEWRAVETDEEAKHTYVDGTLGEIKP